MKEFLEAQGPLPASCGQYISRPRTAKLAAYEMWRSSVDSGNLIFTFLLFLVPFVSFFPESSDKHLNEKCVVF